MTDDHYWLARVELAALSLARSSLFQGTLHALGTHRITRPSKGPGDVNPLLVKFVASETTQMVTLMRHHRSPWLSRMTSIPLWIPEAPIPFSLCSP